MIIYKCTNIKNGKVYIGATIRTLNERKNQHIRCALLNKDDNKRYFYNAIRKHGVDNFIWEIIDSSDSYEQLMEKEKYWIKYYNSFGDNGYNSCEGGNNSTGYKHTDEAKKVISEKAKLRKVKTGEESPFYGKTLSEDTKTKISLKLSGEKNPMHGKTFYDIWNDKYSENEIIEKTNNLINKHKEKSVGKNNPMYGKKHSAESRKKISESKKEYYLTHENKNKGKHVHTEEQKEKWSKERKGRKLDEEWLNNIREARKKIRKKVINLDTLEVFDSITIAQNAYGLKNGIGQVCRGKKKTAGKQHWQFYEEYLKNNDNENN